jgi:hypothetical protein
MLYPEIPFLAESLGGEDYVLRAEYGADPDKFAPMAFPPPYEVGLGWKKEWLPHLYIRAFRPDCFIYTRRL